MTINMTGKKNIVFGMSYLVATLSLGFYMAYAMFASGQRGTWLNSPMHALVKQAHAHGNLEALVNIVAGILICLFGARSPKRSQAASLLLIAGALMHSGAFYLGGLGLTIVVRAAFFGPFLLIAGIALMVPVTVRGIDGTLPLETIER